MVDIESEPLDKSTLCDVMCISLPGWLSRAVVAIVSDAEVKNLYARRRHANIQVFGTLTTAQDLGALQLRHCPELRPRISRNEQI